MRVRDKMAVPVAAQKVGEAPPANANAEAPPKNNWTSAATTVAALRVDKSSPAAMDDDDTFVNSL